MSRAGGRCGTSPWRSTRGAHRDRRTERRRQEQPHQPDPPVLRPHRGVVEVDGCDLRRIQIPSLRQQIGWCRRRPSSSPAPWRRTSPTASRTRPGGDGPRPRSPRRMSSSPALRMGTTRSWRGRDAVVGGPAQRLALARGVLNKPGDPDPRRGHVRARRGVRGGHPRGHDRLTERRTTFIIAHRLSTVRSAHRIVVLLDGGIVEMGSHTIWRPGMGRTAAWCGPKLIDEAFRAPATTP